MQASQVAKPQKLNFPAVSSGYLGIEDVDTSFNSKFYASLYRENWVVSRNRLEVFPQRVPVLGFFDELLDIETREFKSSFGVQKRRVLRQLVRAWSLKSENPEYFCNALDLAARFGVSNEIVGFANSTTDADHTLVRFKLELGAIFIQREMGAPRGLGSLMQLAEQTPSPLLESLILARIIVESVRHSEISQIELTKIGDRIRENLEVLSPTKVVEYVWLSMIFRALPMIPGTSGAEARHHLGKALDFAMLVDDGSERTAFARADLIATTLQSTAKLNIKLKDFDAAEACLTKMVERDPNDAVGFSELGLFQFKSQKFNDAIANFERAVFLGPPATGMNLFYLGKCSLALGDPASAEVSFRRGIDFDPLGISHFLALIDLLKNLGRRAEAMQLKVQILMNDDLKSQLNDDELRSFEDD